MVSQLWGLEVKIKVAAGSISGEAIFSLCLLVAFVQMQRERSFGVFSYKDISAIELETHLHELVYL